MSAFSHNPTWLKSSFHRSPNKFTSANTLSSYSLCHILSSPKTCTNFLDNAGYQLLYISVSSEQI
ncbi:hypothetical protein APHNYW_1613 [Anaplasma phagocytophilum str. ApNYW]|nr:hypothetical protein APHNYW_1613 [Anaplasma phagocytophilum str. ApNYW]